MNALSIPISEISTEDLSRVLQELLTRSLGGTRQIKQLEHRPSPNQSSFLMQDLDVSLDDGTELQLVLKDLNAPSEAAEQVKPSFVRDPSREIEAYRRVLPRHPLGTARCYGGIVDAEKRQYWLFLERVQGLELYLIGEFEIWEQVAGWLAEFHNAFTTDVPFLRTATPLLHYDADFYRIWIYRAAEFAGQSERPFLERLAQNYDRVIERFVHLSPTCIHGEFYASNILVEQTPQGLRVCPVDWEMAATGPGILDAAALAAGNWAEAEKTQLARAYYAASATRNQMSMDEFLDDFAYARLHVAVQWLGWARNWSPPAEHAQDWLREAQTLADRLGL